MDLPNYIIKLSYRLDNSPRYIQIKQLVTDILENPKSRFRYPFDIAMIILVLSSIAVLIYEVKNDLGLAGLLFEWFAVSIFLIEYLLRFWVYSDMHDSIIKQYEQAEFLEEPFRLSKAVKELIFKKWAYMTQPLAIIDLLAILPAYRPIRLLRVFLVFRLFKLLRYTNSLKQFTSVLAEKRSELFTLGVFLTFVIVAAASAIYVFEVNTENTHIHSLYDALYWAIVTLTTVGYGDITPQTNQGRAIAMLLIVVGIGVISFFTSIIVSAFTEKLPEINKQRIYNELERKAGHTILCGYGRLGQNVASHLQKYKERVVVVDNQLEAVSLAKQRGMLTLHGSAESNELLESLNIQGAKRVLCLTDSDITNIYITLSARQLNPGIEIFAKVNQSENEIKLMRAGANHTISPFKTAGLLAAQYAEQPVAFEAFFGLLTDDDEITFDTLSLHEGSDLVNQKTGDIDFQAHRLILFGVVSEEQRSLQGNKAAYQMAETQFYFNPGDDFPLIENDLLIVFGHQYSIMQFREKYGLVRNR
jgi:voltage-gated potassium channel